MRRPLSVGRATVRFPTLFLLLIFSLFRRGSGRRKGICFMEIEKPTNYPKSLFKFYSNSKYSLEAFLENYIYMSHPYQFNDLMDTRPYTIDARNIDKSTFDILKQNAINETPEIQEYYNFCWNGDCNYGVLQSIQTYIFCCKTL